MNQSRQQTIWQQPHSFRTFLDALKKIIRHMSAQSEYVAYVSQKGMSIPPVIIRLGEPPFEPSLEQQKELAEFVEAVQEGDTIYFITLRQHAHNNCPDDACAINMTGWTKDEENVHLDSHLQAEYPNLPQGSQGPRSPERPGASRETDAMRIFKQYIAQTEDLEREPERLRQKIERLERHIDQSGARAAEMLKRGKQSIREEMDFQIASNKMIIEQGREQVTRLQKIIDEMSSGETRELVAQLESEMNTSSELRARAETLQRQLQERANNEELLQDQLAAEEELTTNLRTTVKTLEQELQGLWDQVNEEDLLKDQSPNDQRTNTELRTQLERLQQQLKTLQDRPTNGGPLQAQLKDEQETNALLRIEAERLQEQFQSLQDSTEDQMVYLLSEEYIANMVLRRQVVALQADSLQSIQNRVNPQAPPREELLRNDVESLRQLVQTFQDRVRSDTELRVRLGETSKHVKRLQDDLQASRSRETALRNNLGSPAELKRRIIETDKKCTKLQNELAEARKHASAQLVAQLADSLNEEKNKCAWLQDQLNDCRNKSARLQRQLNDKQENDPTELQQELDDAREKSSSQERTIDLLKDTLETERKNVKEVQEQLKACHDRSALLRQQLDEAQNNDPSQLQTELNKTREEMESQETTSANLEELLEQETEKATRLQDELNSSRERITELEFTLAVEQRAFATSAREADRLRNELADQDNEAAILRHDLATERENFGQQRREHYTAFYAQDEELRNLRTQVADLQSQNSNLQAHIQSLPAPGQQAPPVHPQDPNRRQPITQTVRARWCNWCGEQLDRLVSSRYSQNHLSSSN